MDEAGSQGAAQTVPRVVATPAALALIERLKAQHGALMFHQSGGCCDGSAPMCYPAGEFPLGDHDVRLGEIGGVPFHMAAAQYERWRHTQLLIDVVEGRGGMFSLEGPHGLRFLTRSRLLDADGQAGPQAGSGAVRRGERPGDEREVSSLHGAP